MGCNAGLARLLCGDVAWWAALLICSGALALGFLATYLFLRATGRWHSRKRRS
jgi:hypothetical protein